MTGELGRRPDLGHRSGPLAGMVREQVPGSDSWTGIRAHHGASLASLPVLVKEGAHAVAVLALPGLSGSRDSVSALPGLCP
jgi:hypothetical protein